MGLQLLDQLATLVDFVLKVLLVVEDAHLERLHDLGETVDQVKFDGLQVRALLLRLHLALLNLNYLLDSVKKMLLSSSWELRSAELDYEPSPVIDDFCRVVLGLLLNLAKCVLIVLLHFFKGRSHTECLFFLAGGPFTFTQEHPI